MFNFTHTFEITNIFKTDASNTFKLDDSCVAFKGLQSFHQQKMGGIGTLSLIAVFCPKFRSGAVYQGRKLSEYGS
jgi:hypothetical protein